jgi:hypothetical protein
MLQEEVYDYVGDFTVKNRQLYYNLCSVRLGFAKPGCFREPRKIPNESPFSAEFRGI